MQYAGLYESILKRPDSSLNTDLEGKKASIFIFKGKF